MAVVVLFTLIFNVVVLVVVIFVVVIHVVVVVYVVVVVVVVVVIILVVSHAHTAAIIITHTITQTHMLTLAHSLTHTITRAHAHSLTHTLTHSLTHSHTHTHHHTRTPTHHHTRTPSHSHAHTHTHTCTHRDPAQDERDVSEDVRKRLKELTKQDQWDMYRSHIRQCSDFESSVDSPSRILTRLRDLTTTVREDLSGYLSDDLDRRVTELTSIVNSIIVSLRTSHLKWVASFVELDGVTTLFDMFRIMSDSVRDADLHTDLVVTVKALLNTGVGCSSVMAHEHAVSLIARSLHTANLRTKTIVLEVLGAMCLLPDGHRTVLAAFDALTDYLHERTRFQALMTDLMVERDSGTRSMAFRVAAMAFINAIICSGVGKDNVEFRVHLRNEFILLGLEELVDYLQRFEDANLAAQLEVFDEFYNSDSEVMADRYQLTYEPDTENPEEVFNVLLKTTEGTPGRPLLTSLLNHLLLLPYDPPQRRFQFMKLIDRITSQIVLQHQGEDIDYEDIQILVDEAIGILVSQERLKELEDAYEAEHTKAVQLEKDLGETRIELEGVRRKRDKLQRDVTTLQEEFDKAKATSAEREGALQRELASVREQLSAAQARLQHLESHASHIQGEMDRLRAGGAVLGDMSGGADSGAPPPPPPPMPGMDGPGGPPPPPPPPGMDGFGAPPPPPPPGMDGFGAPPPPPPPGMGGPPPPPGMGMPAMDTRPKLPNRRRPKAMTPLRGLNWVKLPDNVISKTIWMDLDDTKVANMVDLEELERLFNANPQTNQPDPAAVAAAAKLRENKEVTVIDPRRGQNVAIALKKIKMPPHDIIAAVLAADTKRLPAESCEQLIKFVPENEERDALEARAEEAENFSAADKFMLEAARLPRYAQRLEAMYFKAMYDAKMADLRPQVECMRKAVKQLQNSKQFKRVLEFVLLFGNYMNKGTRGDAYGFRISTLLKLADTKSAVKTQINLLHFLVEVIDNKQPEVCERQRHRDRGRQRQRQAETEIEAMIMTSTETRAP
jgi:dishevelled associated activator of morphogenesis